MELILLQDVKGLGEQYQTVTVKPGYGRNYLIPQGFATLANRASKAQVAQKIKQSQTREEKMRSEMETMVGRIRNNPIRVGAKVGATDKIFGSVTNVQLAEAIREQTGVEVNRRKIEIPEDIKTLGSYKAHIRFSETFQYDIDFEVVAD